jgi:hypothetical protein
MEGVKISKTEYAVFVQYKVESKYKKSSKFEEIMVQNQKKMSDLKWNASYNIIILLSAIDIKHKFYPIEEDEKI